MKTCRYTEDFLLPESNFHFHIYNMAYPELHDHDYWEFFIILSGEVEHYTENSKQILSKGMCCLVHPRDKHRFANVSNAYQQMNICVTDHQFKELLNVLDEELYGLIFSVNHPLFYELDGSTMHEIYKNIHAAQTSSNDKTKFSNFLKVIWLDIIKIIYRNIAHLNSNHPEWLTNFLRTIASPEHLTKPISELHELTFYSYRHLNRLFKEYMGETLHDYVSALKMNYGATLLRTTDMGILEISSACAYDSLSHFIKMFKRHFKMTPKEYRRSFKYFPEKGI